MHFKCVKKVAWIHWMQKRRSRAHTECTLTSLEWLKNEGISQPKYLSTHSECQQGLITQNHTVAEQRFSLDY